MSPAQPLIGIPVYKDEARYSLGPSYSDGVLASGGAPVQIPQGMGRDTLRTIFDRVDGVLLAGGGDVDPAFYDEPVSDHVRSIDRERDEIEIALTRWAVAEGKPFFAICRGIQVMNVALGGNLYQDVLTDMPGAITHAFFSNLGYARDYLAHDVELVPHRRLTRLLGGGSLAVNSMHHQGIKSLAPELTLVGRAPDGLIEAVEVDGHDFAVGVQWHPEELAPEDPVNRRLFDGFVKAARNRIK